MLKSFLRTSLRAMRANKVITTINILGLTSGLAICLLILFYVNDELAFDRYNTRLDRIYRVNTDLKIGGNATSRAIAAPQVAIAIQNSFPGVEKVVRILPGSERFRKNNIFVQEDRVAYCDSSIFDVFTLKVTEGSPETALTEPKSIVVTESMALKYFNKLHVVGETLSTVDDSNHIATHKITAVVGDIPAQSHFHFDFFLPLAPVQVSHRQGFGALFPFSTYLLLKPGTDVKNVEAGLPAFVRKNVVGIDEMERTGDYFKLSLTALKDIHLYSNRTNELGTNGDIKYVRIFLAMAVFVLIMACINFMNLATARSSDRAREVGIRKVLGSSRSSLIIQFLLESTILAFIATLLAIVVSVLLLPLFNSISGKDLTVSMAIISWLFLLLLVLSILVGLLAGAYPAFFLSSFKPVATLSGKLSSGFKRGSLLRNFLVVFQFSISVFLIIGTLVIYGQLNYIQNKDLGFTRDQVLIVKNLNSIEQEAQTFKQQVKQLPGVESVTMSSFLPTGDRRWLNYLSYPSGSFETEFWPVDEDYLNTMGMRLANGRNFSKNLVTDSSAIIVNETAAELLGYAGDPLNKPLFSGDRQKEYHIIGVVKDFNFSSLRDNINPVVMMMMTSFERKKEGDGPDNLCIRIHTGNLPSVLGMIRSKWDALSPQQSFDYAFMDEQFDAIYRAEQRMGKTFAIFTSLAILIACLGLYALAAYDAEQRRKEISIRKVLGADNSSIVVMLSKNFLKLVLISIIIAIPAGWFVMSNWLEDFAYREDIHWWLFLIAGISSLLVAFFTISFQSLKAANDNPVNNLRSE